MANRTENATARRSRVCAGVGVAAASAAGVALAAWHGAAGASPTEELTPLRTACASFPSARMYLTVTGIEDIPLRYSVAAHASGRIAFDSGDGDRRRISWDGSRLQEHALHWEGPRVLDGPAGRIVADIWRECRSGFADTTWVAESPFDAGYQYEVPGYSWARADLPFAWAQGLSLWVAVSPQSGRLNLVVGLVGDAWFKIEPTRIDWDAGLDSGWFSAHAPNPPEPIPKEWRYRSDHR